MSAGDGLPLGNGTVLVEPLLYGTPWLQAKFADSTGRATFDIPITTQKAWSGLSVHLQSYVPDSGVQGGWALSGVLSGRLH